MKSPKLPIPYLAIIVLLLAGCSKKSVEERAMNQSLWDTIDNPEAISRAFYPRRAPRGAPQGALDFDIPVGGGVTVGARWFLIDKSKRTILFFHGNGETAGDYDDVARRYALLGLNLFVADYRGYGWSGGSPSFRALREDAPKIAEFFFQEIGPNAPAPVIMGRSLGSSPACDLALAYPNKFRGLILESGFGDVTVLLRLFQIATGRHEQAVSELFSNHLKLRKIMLPVLILHGEDDDLLPAGNARLNFANIQHEEKTLKIIPGVGHNDLLLKSNEYFGAISDFVTSLK